MFSKITYMLCLLFSTGALASFNPPSHCVEDGTGPNGLSIEGSKYVALNESRRFKGDYPFHFPTPYDDRVTFFNSESGEVGRDSTNLESNAYMNVSFYYSRGPGWVWVQSDNDINSCAKMRVYVSEPPSAEKISLTGGRVIVAKISSEIDTLYSKNAREGNRKASLTYIFLSETPGIKPHYINTESEQVSYRPAFNGFYNVSVQVSDGSSTYYLDLGGRPYSGGRACSTCGPIP